LILPCGWSLNFGKINKNNSKREGFGTESEIYLATLAFLNLFLFIFVLVN